MAQQPYRSKLGWKGALLGLSCILVCGCRGTQANVDPAIEFNRIPKADEGGTESRALIEGRVTGARPGQQIVLYARSGSGIWWVQPFADQAFTAIQQDSKWSNSTHLGTEYAALLVTPGYRPPATLDAMPSKGSGISAVSIAKGTGPARAVSRTLHFSGYEWEIRQVPSDRGGTLNTYDAANAWTDIKGWLHLRISRGKGEWTCSEVVLTRSLGYGSYRFVVHDVGHLEPAAVLGMFTWDDLGEDQNHREVDLEVSRWGDPDTKNSQYVVQPYYVPANVLRFVTPSGVITHSFRWEPGRLSFKSFPGNAADSRAVAEHVFTSGVPSPGGESVRMNLYVYGKAGTPLKDETEVVIEKFEYLP